MTASTISLVHPWPECGNAVSQPQMFTQIKHPGNGSVLNCLLANDRGIMLRGTAASCFPGIHQAPCIQSSICRPTGHLRKSSTCTGQLQRPAEREASCGPRQQAEAKCAFLTLVFNSGAIHAVTRCLITELITHTTWATCHRHLLFLQTYEVQSTWSTWLDVANKSHMSRKSELFGIDWSVSS